jgi:hypothetical protein
MRSTLLLSAATRLLLCGPALAISSIAVACGGGPARPPSAAPEPPPAADRATVPLHVEGNRPFIDVALRKPDGSTRSARFLIDSGGGGFLIVEPLAKELGLTLGETMNEQGQTLAEVRSPVQASVGGLPLELDPRRVLVMIGKDSVLPAATTVRADGMLPGHVLARYHVVFDYPGAAFTLAKPGVLRPVGAPLPMPVSPSSGFPRTELQVDGKTHGFLLDTGAAFTMVSEALLASWGAAHPDWPRHPGAFGEAALLGGQTLETMFVPRAAWGTLALEEVGVTSQRQGTFENWMSAMMTAPIVGALAGNVLKRFRIELDYPNQQLYVSGP